MEALAYLIVYLVIGYLPWTITAYRLMTLAGYQRTWRAFIPLWNFFMVLDLAEKSRLYLVLFLIPIVSLVALVRVGGALAENTGQPKWVGWICAFPIVHIIGLPILALTASSESNLPREFLPGTEGEFRYRYKGVQQAATPVELAESRSATVSLEPTTEQARHDSQKRAIAQIRAYLDEGHSLDALRSAGWDGWIRHLESEGYDLRTGEMKISPPSEEPPQRTSIDPPRSAP